VRAALFHFSNGSYGDLPCIATINSGRLRLFDGSLQFFDHAGDSRTGYFTGNELKPGLNLWQSLHLCGGRACRQPQNEAAGYCGERVGQRFWRDLWPPVDRGYLRFVGKRISERVLPNF
jgi:hypothetical protein